MDRENQIRERAHSIWKEEGEPQDKAHEHWQRAERELDDDASQLHEDMSGSPQPGKIGGKKP